MTGDSTSRRRGFSPLERRCLLGLVSLIRDRESDPSEWPYFDIPLRTLYEHLYTPGERPWELERRNQRQAQRRALGRLREQGFLSALALAWVDVPSGDLVRWQGGGSKGLYQGDTWLSTPRWRRVGLTPEGIAAALALEQNAHGTLDVAA